MLGAARGGSRLPPIVCGAPGPEAEGAGGEAGLRWGGCERLWGCFGEPRAEGLPRLRRRPPPVVRVSPPGTPGILALGTARAAVAVNYSQLFLLSNYFLSWRFNLSTRWTEEMYIYLFF